MKFALAAARANLACTRPGFGRAEVRVPERPRFALTWSCVVHRALSRFAIEENAVAVFMLGETLANAKRTYVGSLKVLNVHADIFGQRFDFGLVHPDKTRGSRATIATLGAFETQSVFVPGCFSHAIVLANRGGVVEGGVGGFHNSEFRCRVLGTGRRVTFS